MRSRRRLRQSPDRDDEGSTHIDTQFMGLTSSHRATVAEKASSPTIIPSTHFQPAVKSHPPSPSTPAPLQAGVPYCRKGASKGPLLAWLGPLMVTVRSSREASPG